ncbi:HigA family addiction module antitoxin [Mesorhizobium marinum]|uniref:HigA family addiction module antitoxin n=1 Tax=Mesorhizobium marinum TaxID=3228790 RepID=A0ABV3QUZ1_9HYPH
MNAPRPIHPGEILREDFFPEYSLTAGSLAKALHVPRDRIEKLVREKRSITADTAMRLARYFDTTPQFWMNLQANYDLATVPAEAIKSIEPRAA